MAKSGESLSAARWAEAGIVVAALAAYHNIFANAFVFLDGADIADNPTIRHLWPLTRVLSPPVEGGLTVGGRPLVNLSLALNYAISGTAVWSYHAVNLMIHVLAGLTLFGIVRRTVRQDATWVAFAVALLWTVHPLQTEAVTYVVQRAESLMGLFYLLTIYCFIRYSSVPPSFVPPGGTSAGKEAGRKMWGILTFVACLFGMASKEVMVSAPVIVFLYDAVFVSGTFAAAWRRRWRLYLTLAATWFVLGGLVLRSGGRGGSAGFGIGVSWGSYVLTQFPAILHYLRLAVWPRPLIFDYWVQWVQQPGEVALPALIVLVLAAGSAGLLLPSARRLRWLAFLGLFFFAILAPTSLVPGKSQTLAEHRMYLALAPAVVLAVLGLARGFGRRGLMIFTLAAGAASVVATLGRNQDYRSDRTLWEDTVAKRPQNARAHYYLGVALGETGRTEQAVEEFNRALTLNPDYPEAYDSLGIVRAKAGENLAAIPYYRRALALRPAFADARYNLGTALAQTGRVPEGIAELEAALKLKAEYPEAQNNLASALVKAGRASDAVAHYREALRLRTDYPGARSGLGVALAMSGRLPEAIAQFQEEARLRPQSAQAHYNLAGAWLSSGRAPEAIAEYERAVRLRPDYYEARYQLGVALRAAGRGAEADSQFEQAERLQGAAAVSP